MGIIKPIGSRCRGQATGQTVQYSSVENDGYFKKGHARNYVALSTGDYSGTTNITVNSKTIAMENACVFDQNSGLMWMKYTPDSDIGSGNDGKLHWYDAADREDIFEFCDQANAQNLAGHNDWRVPNTFEFFTLVVEDTGIGAPYIDTNYFQCISHFYWSSTTYPPDVARALGVFFDKGHGGVATKALGLYYVRLVREG